MLQYHYEEHTSDCDTVRFNDDRYPCTCGGSAESTADTQEIEGVAKPSTTLCLTISKPLRLSPGL